MEKLLRVYTFTIPSIYNLYSEGFNFRVKSSFLTKDQFFNAFYSEVINRGLNYNSRYIKDYIGLLEDVFIEVISIDPTSIVAKSILGYTPNGKRSSVFIEISKV